MILYEFTYTIPNKDKMSNSEQKLRIELFLKEESLFQDWGTDYAWEEFKPPESIGESTRYFYQVKRV